MPQRATSMPIGRVQRLCSPVPLSGFPLGPIPLSGLPLELLAIGRVSALWLGRAMKAAPPPATTESTCWHDGLEPFIGLEVSSKFVDGKGLKVCAAARRLRRQ